MHLIDNLPLRVMPTREQVLSLLASHPLSLTGQAEGKGRQKNHLPKQVVFWQDKQVGNVRNRQKEMTTGALVKELMVAVAFFM